MRCTHCGLPLSPTRNMSNCPRCNAPLNSLQEVGQQAPGQASWGNTGRGSSPQHNVWGQGTAPDPYSPFPQQAPQNQAGPRSMGASGINSPLGSELRPSQPPPGRPSSFQRQARTARLGFSLAALCVLLGGLLLIFVYVLASASPSPGNPSPNTNNPLQTSVSPTASNISASPSVSASPSATSTSYPGQQYIDSAQMAMGVDKSNMQAQQPTTTFTVGSNMYVVFNLHPPSQGGAVCSYWYLHGKQITTPYSFSVKGSQHASYTYANFNSAGPAYVELYWASDKSCADQILAQHVDFTVTT